MIRGLILHVMFLYLSFSGSPNPSKIKENTQLNEFSRTKKTNTFTTGMYLSTRWSVMPEKPNHSFDIKSFLEYGIFNIMSSDRRHQTLSKWCLIRDLQRNRLTNLEM